MQYYTIKVRTAHERTGKPCTYRLSDGQGRLTIRRIHAAMIADKAKAEAVAAKINADNPDCKAWVENF